MRPAVLALQSILVVSAACSCEPPQASETASSVPQAPTASAAELLEQMDTRTPLPLLPQMANHQKQNMRDHLAAVEEMVAALATDDFTGVERSAARLGFSEQMGQMCTHLGAGAPGFSEQALNFHHTADRISAAAREHDRKRVLTELGATLHTCTSCHAAWKQQVVDASTWTRLTSSLPPMHRMPP